MPKLFTLDAPHIESLYSPNELKNELPAAPHHYEFIQNIRQQIVRILMDEDPRQLLIVGPCSIHDPESAKEYASKLRELSQHVSKHFLIIMRTYFEKPRTATGWKGLLYDPHLDGSCDISLGLRTARKLLIELADMQVPTATEFLDPVVPRFFGDLISWACIGARTAESQVHRQLASGLSIPIAFKNSTSGRIDVAINGVLSARQPHAFLGIDDSGQLAIQRTQGNAFAHIALRGGENRPNYDPESINQALALIRKAKLPSSIIIDCSHDNSLRDHKKQIAVFQSVIQQYVNGNRAIRGMALESHLNEGKQSINEASKLKYAVSLTDPCLDWLSTEVLILWAYNLVSKEQTNFQLVSQNILA